MKTNVKITLGCCLLAAALVSVGCGSAEQPGTAGTDNAEIGNIATEEVATEDPGIRDNVPALDFGGYLFRTVEQEGKTFPFYQESESGDVISDAIYARNKYAEERFNIKFAETQSLNYVDISTKVTNAVMSGSDEYDLVFGQMFHSASIATNGVFLDWNTLPYVELSNPWYTKSIQDSSIGSRLLMVESDLSLSYTEQTWFMLYNKSKYASFYPDGDNLYEVVDSGKFTIDYLNALVKDCYQDVNGDGTRDAGDFYGIGSYQDGCQVAAFYFGCGCQPAVLKDDMTIEHTIESEKSIDVLTRLGNLFNQTTGSISRADKLINGFFDGRALFVNGQLLFCPQQIGGLLSGEIRGFSGDFGVLPLPKYEEAQSEYFTGVDGGADIMTIPCTVSDEQKEIIGAVTEGMSCYCYNTFIPTYCGEGLSFKGARDEESIRMIRKILDSRVINFSYLYDGFSGWVMKMPDYLLHPEKCASSIEKNKKSIDKYFNKIIAAFTEENE